MFDVFTNLSRYMHFFLPVSAKKGSSHHDGLGARLCDYRNSRPLDTCYFSNYMLGLCVPLSYASPLSIF